MHQGLVYPRLKPLEKEFWVERHCRAINVCCNHDLSGSDMHDIVYICKLNQIRIFSIFHPDVGLYVFYFVYRVHAQFYDKNNQITTIWHLR